MTTAVTIKNITFQEGTTLICVPLIGQTLDELKAHARTLAEAGADLIEWRVDHFTAVGDQGSGPAGADGDSPAARRYTAAVHLPQP